MQPRHVFVRFIYLLKTKSSLLIFSTLGSWFVSSQLLRCSPSVLVLCSPRQRGTFDFCLAAVWFLSRHHSDLIELLSSVFGQNLSFSAYSQVMKIRELCASFFQSHYLFSFFNCVRRKHCDGIFSFESGVRVVIDDLWPDQSFWSTRVLKPFGFRYSYFLYSRELSLTFVSMCVFRILFCESCSVEILLLLPRIHKSTSWWRILSERCSSSHSL